MAETGAIDEAVAASRRLYPDVWQKADHIAEIIEPGAFAEWENPETGEILDNARMRYKRSRARAQAWQILRYLGLAPENTDWLEIFAEIEDPTP